MFPPPPASVSRQLAIILSLVLLPPGLEGQTPRESWVLVEDLRIGSLDRPNYTLTKVRDLAIGKDGSIYVGQDMDKLIRVFDSDGRFVRTIGREGGGPGEFQSISSLGWRADTLSVVDFVQTRVSQFSAGGEHLHTFRFDGPMLPESSRPTPPNTLFPDGSIVATPLIGSQEDIDSLPILRMDRGGEILDTLGMVSARGGRAVIRTEEITIHTFLPVPSNSLWEVSPADSSILIVHRPIPENVKEGTFRVQKFGSTGAAIFDRHFRYTPKPVPEDFYDFAARHPGFLERASRAMDRSELIQLVHDSIPIPELQPAITQLTAGRDGTIWLRRDGLETETVRWIVLNTKGDIIAELTAPAELEILVAQRDMVWGVMEDELEVSYVVRFRVTRAPASSR